MSSSSSLDVWWEGVQQHQRHLLDVDAVVHVWLPNRQLHGQSSPLHRHDAITWIENTYEKMLSLMSHDPSGWPTQRVWFHSDELFLLLQFNITIWNNSAARCCKYVVSVQFQFETGSVDLFKQLVEATLMGRFRTRLNVKVIMHVDKAEYRGKVHFLANLIQM